MRDEEENEKESNEKEKVNDTLRGIVLGEERDLFILCPFIPEPRFGLFWTLSDKCVTERAVPAQ